MRNLLLFLVLTLASASQVRSDDEITPEMKKLLLDLQNPKGTVRIDAVTALRKMGETAMPIANDLVKTGILSKDKLVREATLDVFEKLNPKIHKFLMQTTSDKQNNRGYRNALYLLEPFDSDSRCLMPMIQQFYALESTTSYGYVTDVMRAAVKIAPDDPWTIKIVLTEVSRPTTPASRQTYNSQEYGSIPLTSYVRVQAIELASELKIDDKTRLKALLSGLPNPDHRPKVIAAIGTMGSAAAEAVPALNRYKQDKSAGTRDAVKEALEKISP